MTFDILGPEADRRMALQKAEFDAADELANPSPFAHRGRG